MNDRLPDNITRFDLMQIEHNKRKLCVCEKPNFEIDTTNRMLSCKDCKAIIEPFEALIRLERYFNHRDAYWQQRLEEKQRIANYKPRLTTIKRLADMYGATNATRMVPTCPRCHEPFDLAELLTRVWVNPKYLPKSDEAQT